MNSNNFLFLKKLKSHCMNIVEINWFSDSEVLMCVAWSRKNNPEAGRIILA